MRRPTPSFKQLLLPLFFTTRTTTMATRILDRVFSSCDDDPKGSVHRAWGVSLIFVVLYFIVSVMESEWQSVWRECCHCSVKFISQLLVSPFTSPVVNLHSQGGSKALVMASIWTGIIHILLGILGTFVLKRFPTSFSVGFLLGCLVVLANQNFILFGTFHGYNYGTMATNNAFSNLCLTIGVVLAFFATTLFHFKQEIVVAPVDAPSKEGSTSYQQYEEEDA